MKIYQVFDEISDMVVFESEYLSEVESFLLVNETDYPVCTIKVIEITD